MNASSSGGALPRPRQVTMAGWLIMVGSTFVVLAVFERMAGMNSLEIRTAAEQFVADTPGAGLDVEGVLTVLRVLTMVAGACAAASAILGFHVLRRSRGARLGVSVLALPLFVSGMVAGGFLSSLVAAAAVLLWLEPSRDWFDGRPARRHEPAPEASPGQPPRPVPPMDAGGSGAAGPRPHQGFGAPPAAAPTGAPPAPTWATQVPPPPWRPQRPDTVLWACILTWVFSGLAAVLMGLTALVLATTPDLLFEQLQRQNPELLERGSEGMYTSALYTVAAVTVVWSVAASTLAVLLFRRVRWARVALLVSTASVAGLLMLGVLASSFLLLVPLAACGVTFSLLLRPEVRHWVAAP